MITAILEVPVLQTYCADYGWKVFGSTRGPCVGHVSPEAALGGPIAFIEDGDKVLIDLKKGILELKVPESVLKERKRKWRPVKKELKGILKLYATMSPRTNNGAVWQV